MIKKKLENKDGMKDNETVIVDFGGYLKYKDENNNPIV